MDQLIESLINKVINGNGNGAKLLRSLVETGEITPAEEVIVLLRTQLIRLEDRVDDLEAKIDTQINNAPAV